MVKFDLYRFIDKMDIEDVTLKNRGDYNVLDSGEWLTPAEFNGMDSTWQRSNFVSSSDQSSRLSRLVWMEKGRTDARAVGKVSVISGDGVKGKTEVYLKADELNFAEGDELTIAEETDNTSPHYGKIVFAQASSGDVVKAICIVAPTHDPDNLLHFELKN